MTSKSLTVDEVYDTIGHFGFSQVVYLASLSLMHYFTCHHMLMNIFVGLELSFSCTSKEEENIVLSNECPKNLPENCILTYNTTFHSIAEEWDLVCNRKYKLPLVQSVFMGGVMAGALLLGGVADKIGRLPTLLTAIMGTVAFEGISAFAPNYEVYISLRFLGGVCCSLVIFVSFVLAQEFVGSSKRSFACIIMAFFSSFGIFAMTLAAAFVSNWRSLVFVSSFSGLGFLLIIFFLPESPRWLLGQGYVEKSRSILVCMAQLNRTEHLLPKHWSLVLPDNNLKSNTKSSCKSLFSHPFICKITLIQIYSWFVTSATYYALTLAATSLPGNIYFSTALSGLVEIPASIVGLYALERLGRRMSICTSMLITACSCLLIPILTLVWPSAISISALIGKLCISATFSFIYIHSGELFPTVVRNTGMGVVSVAARVGGIASPFILLLKDIKPNLDYFTLGFMALISAFLNLYLPETMGRPMPETLSDIINMKFMSCTTKTDTSDYSKLLNEEKMDDEIHDDSDAGNESE